MDTRYFSQGVGGVLAAGVAFFGGLALLFLGHAIRVGDEALVEFGDVPDLR